MGVTIDQQLTWKPHILLTSRKISKSIGVLRKVSKHLPKNALMQLYSSFVLPYLQYGITLWGSSATTTINSLFIAQKKSLKIALSLPLRTPTSEVLNTAQVLSIKNLFSYYIGIFMFKFTNSILPHCFDNYFIPTSQIHNHSTRNSTSFQLPLFNTNKCQQSILFQGAKIWPTIPNSIQNSPSFPSFKNRFKKHLLALQRQG